MPPGLKFVIALATGGAFVWPLSAMAEDVAPRANAQATRQAAATGTAPYVPFADGTFQEPGRTVSEVRRASAELFAPVISEGRALAPKSAEPIRLAPPGDDRSATSGSSDKGPSLVTMVGSLCVVLSIFFIVAWLMKRGMPKSMLTLPSEVLEVLGRAALAPRQNVHLVRCGNKLILVSVTPGGAETLTEITDPVEVDRLTGLCHQQKNGSVSHSFQQALGELTNGKAMQKSDRAAA